MSSVRVKRPVQAASGVISLLLLTSLCAPASARAGCNHLVTSRSNLARHPISIERLSADLAGRSDDAPTSRLPCSGIFCSGQPATPAGPASAFFGTVDDWVWCACEPKIKCIPSSYLSNELAAPEPVRSVSDVFHPPRLIGHVV